MVKVYSFDETAKNLLMLVDQGLFGYWPLSYLSYHVFSLFSGILAVEKKVIH
jgi:hypothetical protein